ncbi:MAG: sugar ABC transporter permease [Provencibacterium sp.]|jgi:putative aldouronate transport system permease protein|nr:sugar ABC transporter permease [Provencibacterium sp.]
MQSVQDRLVNKRPPAAGKKGWRQTLAKDFHRNKYIYLMLLPVVAYFLIFHYQPMYGATIAFKDFLPNKGIMGSPWVGLKHFKSFFLSPSAFQVIRNTIVINLFDLLFGFPAPILLALLLNEINASWFKRSVQTVTYMPHFISLVVICGILRDFTSMNGLFNSLRGLFGLDPVLFLSESSWFRPLYIGSDIWQGVGWGSIIYIAALAGVDQELYEAAKIDGAGRWRRMVSITLPGIAPTIILMLIMRVGRMMSLGSEKVLLLYSPVIYETADVISTFTYRKGLLESNYSYSAAVGLFNSLINFILLLTVNKISKKVSETSLW